MKGVLSGKMLTIPGKELTLGANPRPSKPQDVKAS